MPETPVGNRPSVGRIVHYGPGRYAAIITAVWSDTSVNVTVFDPSGTVYPKSSLLLGAEDGWSWPERVPPFAFPSEVEQLSRG